MGKLIVGISLVSHNDYHLIYKNHDNYYISNKKVKFFVSVIDNVGEDKLKFFCKNKGYKYYRNKKSKGFGENNNLNYRLLNANNHLDFFLTINPDASLNILNFINHILRIRNSKWDISGARVIEPHNNKLYSQRRKFPSLIDPLISLIFKRKRFLMNPEISSNVDWVGGSFMLFRNGVFKKLNGFDTNYFMYYEDADICYRANELGMIVYYFSDFKFYHEAQRKGHKFFSKHFFINLKSMILFFMKFPPKRLF